MIEIENVTMKYNSRNTRNAIENLSLHVENEKAVIVGPNGSGKTTIFKLLAGLVHPAKGFVKVNGVNVETISNQLSLSTNLPEVYRLIGGYVKDVVHMYAEIMGGQAEDAMKLIDSFNLTETLNSKLFELSSGQQKMIANILAFSFSPKIVLLDEPFDNIDQSGRLKLLNIVEKSQADIILNTHEFDLLKRLKDWSLYFMMEGRLFGKFRCSQLSDLFINRGDVEGNLALVKTSIGTYSITEGKGQVPIATAKNLNSLFDEVSQ